KPPPPPPRGPKFGPKPDKGKGDWGPPPDKGKGDWGPPPDKGKGDRGPPPWGQLDRSLSLPAQLQHRFATAPYFVIWRANGEVLKASPEATPLPPPFPRSSPRDEEKRLHVRQRGDLREVVVLGPKGTHVLVGRSIGPEADELERLVWQLVTPGLGVLAVGLA